MITIHSLEKLTNYVEKSVSGIICLVIFHKHTIRKLKFPLN